MKNQVIRIIFDDPVDRGYVDIIATKLQEWVGNHAAIEVYEEEFKDKNTWAKIMAKIKMMVGI